jgi:hypothetical protein
MRFTSETTADGVSERLFILGDIHGVLWAPAGATGTRPLVLLGHGGGQDKKAPGLVARAHRYVTACGLALFDAFASQEKTLHANPGRHTGVPAFEPQSSERFFRRHLVAA